MKTSVSNLKSKIGRYMKAVRSGQEVVVTDRNEPVAKLIPLRPASSIVVAQPRDVAAGPFGARRVAKQRLGFDIVQMLREDRDAR